ncbi:MAG: cellulase family glycosylhydrolase [Victivallales bacterium]|nr:cellulase family glycosylhydrolase [Victivallales bacterium]
MLESGTFTLGVNYWASHAGIKMWRQWRPETIQTDLARLASLGVEHLRIFPLWPDFQPISIYYRQRGLPKELAWKDGAPWPVKGSAVDPEMLERLRQFCDYALEQGLKVVVALVTGWMSGRLFAPPAFEGRNLLTDPQAVYYQLRLVRGIVDALKDHPAIVAWESGNECNCLANSSRDEFRLWYQSIYNAIRAADATRPIFAGLHGLLPAASADLVDEHSWRIGDVAEACDFLTTHPYPAFTPDVGTDVLGSFKSLFHAVAENAFYSDLAGKPCFAEELGTLANVIGSEQIAGRYLDRVLRNLFFHDQRALYWWCAFDQEKLDYPPYTWCAVERELGLFRCDGSLKPVGQAVRDFAEFRRQLPQPPLPPPRRDATVVLTTTQEAWSSAYGAWLLTAQAHFTPRFCFVDQPLPDTALYIVPSLDTFEGMPPTLFQSLLERAKAGATVFVSVAMAMFAPFGQAFGVESVGWEKNPGQTIICFQGEALPVQRQVKMLLKPTGARVLAKDQDGLPVFFEQPCGSGRICLLTLPIERQVAQTPYATELPYWKIYAEMARQLLDDAPVVSSAPQLTMTVHPISPDVSFVALQNNGAEEVPWPEPRWTVETIWPSGTRTEPLRPGEWRLLRCRRAGSVK